MSADWRDPALAERWEERGPQLATRAEQLDIALTALDDTELGDRWILDLGGGSGLVADQILERFPQAKVVCADFSEPMLERARERLERFGDRASFARIDLEGELSLPDHDYAAVIAVQAIHNVSEPAQIAVIRRLSGLLASGALLLLVDKVAVPAAAYPLFVPVWRRLARLGGRVPEPDTYDEYLASLERMGDTPVPLEALLGWLREANFEPALLHVHANRTVIAARAACRQRAPAGRSPARR